MTEQWRPVENYEGFYEVSSEGRVRSCDRMSKCSRGDKKRLWRGRDLSQTVASTRGYKQVSLSKEGVIKKVYVHRLVAEAFTDARDETVNHIDGNKLNNALDNLEWCTYSENNSHAFATGLKKPSGGKNGRKGG